MDAALQKMLLKKACALLAHRAYSRGELGSKLSKAAADHPVDAILDHLEQLNLLNDAEYAYNFAFYRIKDKGWGPAKVHDSLLRRHISPKNIREALERIRSELGEEFALVEHLQKHCWKKGPPADPKEVRKLVWHLQRQGYDDQIIFRALGRVIPAIVLQRFETGE
jgi:regulatory protein